MKMINLQVKTFSLIGISVRTTNENGQSGIDIPVLWNKFISEGIVNQIPNKIDNTIYCLYTAYESDHTKPYTAVLGCKVSNMEKMPKEMTGLTINEGLYIKYSAKGNIMQGLVFDVWKKIWNSDIPRSFTADFEVYGEKAQNPENAEIDIFVAINS